MDLFQYSSKKRIETPLADAMRPRTLEEFAGQEEIVGEGCLLRRAIQADKLGSMIFYGPPGTGKTTLAYIIARTTESNFRQLNAVTSGVKDIREVIKEAGDNLNFHNKKTILFIDEIHRFNKSQQDALLPAVEKGVVLVIGATTENPYFEVNPPLVSRARIFALKPLGEEDIKKILKKAITDEERGLGKYNVRMDPDALDHLSQVADGDARSALNALELAFLTTEEKEGVTHITLSVAEESIQRRSLPYGRDDHYDTISAFIKSMRGSDPDAALYWLAKMLYAGEDPKFICRRMIIHASEDVGMADPSALLVAVAAAEAVERVGLPEGRIPMAQAAIHIATAPKSNACYLAISRAQKLFEEMGNREVPGHLKDSSYRGATELGHGENYKYPHDYPEGYVAQDYLPFKLTEPFYTPTDRGREEDVARRLDELKSRKQGEGSCRK